MPCHIANLSHFATRINRVHARGELQHLVVGKRSAGDDVKDGSIECWRKSVAVVRRKSYLSYAICGHFACEPTELPISRSPNLQPGASIIHTESWVSCAPTAGIK